MIHQQKFRDCFNGQGVKNKKGNIPGNYHVKHKIHDTSNFFDVFRIRSINTEQNTSGNVFVVRFPMTLLASLSNNLKKSPTILIDQNRKYNFQKPCQSMSPLCLSCKYCQFHHLITMNCWFGYFVLNLCSTIAFGKQYSKETSKET